MKQTFRTARRRRSEISAAAIEKVWPNPATHRPFAEKKGLCASGSENSYMDRRLIVLVAWFGPRQPRNFSFLFSRALVARKNSSSSSHAREGR